jgi:MFS transporter, DHA1 family, multidrug resistance protein
MSQAVEITPAERNRGLVLAVLVLLATISPFTINILLPALPGLEQTLSVSRAEVALLLSLFLVGMAVAQVFLGPISDRYGRRPVLIWGLFVYVAASLGAVAAVSINELLVARVLQSLGATVGVPLARTIVRDLYPPPRAAAMLGYVTMGMVIGPMLSPTVGGLLDTLLGWQSIFLACAIMGSVTLVAVVAVMPETRPRELIGTTGREVWDRSVALLGKGKFVAFVLVLAPSSAMFWAFQGGSPYLVIEVMGIDKTIYGVWFALGALGYMSGNFVAGRLSERLGGTRMIAWGNGFAILGSGIVVLLALVPVMHPLALFAPVFVMAIGNGMLLPNAIAGAVSVDPKAAGAASGLLGFCQMGLSAGVSWVSGQISIDSALPMGLLMLTLALVSIAASPFARR